MKRTIKQSKTDNRHTTKPYTHDMWVCYWKDYMKFKNDELARKYNVDILTIYKWNTQMRKELIKCDFIDQERKCYYKKWQK